MGSFAFCNISKLGFLVWPKESIVEDYAEHLHFSEYYWKEIFFAK